MSGCARIVGERMRYYYRTDVSRPHPTVIYFHGGPSTVSGKTDVTLELMRYLSWGVNVVNVEWGRPWRNLAAGRDSERPVCCAVGGCERRQVQDR